MPSLRSLALVFLVTLTGCGSLASSAPAEGDRSDEALAAASTEQASTEQASTEQPPTEQAPTEQAPTEQAPTEQAPTEQPPPNDPPPTTIEPSPAPTSELAGRVTELPSAIGVPIASTAPVPTSMRYEGIGLDEAPIVPVGVEANGEMEVPEASRVGWYRFGPSPGEEGSAVLAAHIAYDGARGAFRDLAQAAAGDRFTIDFDDGSTMTYEVVERAQYDKNELPFDTVFAQSGPAVITLISCGGSFQPSLASYEDNIVAYAIAVG